MPTGVYNHKPLSEATKEKIRVAIKKDWELNRVNKIVRNDKIRYKLTGKKHPQQVIDKIAISLKGNKNSLGYKQTKEHIKNSKNSRILNGYQLSDDVRGSFNLYKAEVMKETRRWIRDIFGKWDGSCYYTKKYIKRVTKNKLDNLYPSIDHKVSIFYGFKHNIPAKQIGDINNLCICSRQANSIKNSKVIIDVM